MRYSDGGGLTPQARVKREQVRMTAAEMFEQDVTPPEVAQALRVSRKSAYGWHQRWRDGGKPALVSTVSKGWPARLTPEQIARLNAELDAGPAGQGWVEDQRWTLARMAVVIKRLFGIDYSQPGVWALLRRMGWSAQTAAHRAVERDEVAIATWVKETWPRVKARRGSGGPGSSLKTSPGSR